MKQSKTDVLCVSCLLLLIVTLFFVPVCLAETTSSSASKTLKIGAIFSLSGFGSEAEILMRDGAVMCQEWINEKGGLTVNGERYLIELLIEDQKGSVDGAVAAATKLVHQDKVKFIIGQVAPPQIMAAGSVTEPAKVIRSLCWGGGVPGTLGTSVPYTFRPVISGAEQVPTIYDYLVEKYPDVKKIALLNPDDPGGQFIQSVSETQARKHGLDVVIKEFYPYGSVDYYPILTKILAAKPDALDVGMGFPVEVAQKLKQAREMGFTGPIFNCNPAKLETVLEMVGEEFGTDYFDSALDMNSPDIPPMIKEEKRRWEAARKEPFEFEAFQGWDALWCLAQAIEKAQSLDPDVVKDTWESMMHIETSYGTARMGGQKTYGIKRLVVTSIPISRVMNGKLAGTKWYVPDIP